MAKPKPIQPPPPPTLWDLVAGEADILDAPGKPDFKREDAVYPKRVKTKPRPVGLKGASTRELLNWLASARACGYGYDPTESGRSVFTIEALKAELATRPHVHNKVSGSEDRRKKAQEQHGPKAPKKKRPRTKKAKELVKLQKAYPHLYPTS